jgi:hypothetical protein
VLGGVVDIVDILRDTLGIDIEEIVIFYYVDSRKYFLVMLPRSNSHRVAMSCYCPMEQFLEMQYVVSHGHFIRCSLWQDMTPLPHSKLRQLGMTNEALISNFP